MKDKINWLVRATCTGRPRILVIKEDSKTEAEKTARTFLGKDCHIIEVKKI